MSKAKISDTEAKTSDSEEACGVGCGCKVSECKNANECKAGECNERSDSGGADECKDDVCLASDRKELPKPSSKNTSNIGEFNFKLPFVKTTEGQIHLQIYAKSKEEADAIVEKLIANKLYTEFPEFSEDSEYVVGDVAYRDMTVRRIKEVSEEIQIQEELLECVE